MAVYTHLAEQDFINVLENFQIGKLVKFDAIANGSENTNYQFYTDRGKYVLTLFEKRVKQKDLPFYINLMNFMVKNNIPSPKVASQIQGNEIFYIKGRFGIIISYLEGDICQNITNLQCREIGIFLANTHASFVKFPDQKNNDYNLNGCLTLFQTVANGNNLSAHKLEFIKSIFQEVSNNMPAGLPKSIIHGDLFPDNLFFKGKQIVGVIDLYFACYDFQIYDLAICICAWCFDSKQSFDQEKALQILKGYNHIRKITSPELASLNTFLLLAALRFYLTRIYDNIKYSADEDRPLKDPLAFYNILQYFANNKLSFKL
jgi:homoserine kinase type II